MKKCNRCGIVKSLEDFSILKGGKQGRRPVCKSCRSEEYRSLYATDVDLRTKVNARSKLNWKRYDLKRKFDITLDKYNDLLLKQNNKCAICGILPDYSLAVDHDHKTGVVRGLLCRKCNLALGLVDDDLEVLYRMIVYLGEFA